MKKFGMTIPLGCMIVPLVICLLGCPMESPPKTYSITFDHQGGTGGTTKVTATYGEPMPTATAPTRTGYTFDGYYTKEGGTGTKYYTSAMAGTQDWDISFNITLYAKWIAENQLLSFDANGGSGSLHPVVVATDEEITLPANSFSKTGYIFVGWAERSDGAIVYNDEDNYRMGLNDTVLYAKWIIIPITRSELRTMILANEDITKVDTSKITDMNRLFEGASSFNQDISGWDVDNVTDMSHMFSGATSFNQDISGWDVGNVTDMSHMFSGATSFNQDISCWDVNNVTFHSDFSSGTCPLDTAYHPRFPLTRAELESLIASGEDVTTANVSKITDMSNLFNNQALAK